MTTAEREGVIKYRLHFVEQSIKLDSADLECFNHARGSMLHAQLIGCDPARYEGLGFGNLSVRLEGSQHFVISATQTGHLSQLGINDLAEVTRCDAPSNQLWAQGLAQPSSEAMTHAVIYQCCARVRAVVHVHSPDIWYHGARLALPATAATIPYGTPAMATAVAQLVARYSDKELAPAQAFVMQGHQDGVVALGADLQACTERLLALQALAQSFTK